ncbi:hypothetical protein [Novosphingobium sp.]|uniref:hypothetical protein n=1 Tax=Novosphingobium sp. TaxID=1874826 RepID=UPI00261D9BB2|nr:hypothetical protein [Novosphingobium sp.]
MHKEKRLTGTLAPVNRPIDHVLAGLNIDGVNLQDAAAWGNNLLRLRDQWADINRKGRRYSDRPSNELPERPARRW